MGLDCPRGLSRSASGPESPAHAVQPRSRGFRLLARSFTAGRPGGCPMHLREFLKAGHFPSLLCAFLYFDISFMIWVLMGPLANRILLDVMPKLEGESAGDYVTRTAWWKGLMLGVPILGGAFIRLILGVLTDRWGARRTAMLGMCVTAVPLL